jgi:hypothetical protein
LLAIMAPIGFGSYCTLKLPFPGFRHQNVGNVGPKSDHVERSDLAKRFFIAGWERERAKRERNRQGRGLNTPQ